MIGGDRTDRLIPVPYSKSSTDQAVRESRTASGRLRSGAAETPVRGKIRFCAAVRHSAPQAILLCLSLLFLPSPSQPHRNWSFIREFALASPSNIVSSGIQGALASSRPPSRKEKREKPFNAVLFSGRAWKYFFFYPIIRAAPRSRPRTLPTNVETSCIATCMATTTVD